MSKYPEMSKKFKGSLAEYVYDYCKSKEINRLNSITSHEVLSEIAFNWFSSEMQRKYRTRRLQHKIMNAVRYTKKGQELFYFTGKYQDYSGMVGFNKPRTYGLIGTEKEKNSFYD